MEDAIHIRCQSPRKYTTAEGGVSSWGALHTRWIRVCPITLKNTLSYSLSCRSRHNWNYDTHVSNIVVNVCSSLEWLVLEEFTSYCIYLINLRLVEWKLIYLNMIGDWSDSIYDWFEWTFSDWIEFACLAWIDWRYLNTGVSFEFHDRLVLQEHELLL